MKKWIQTALIVLLASMFVATSLGVANADEMKIKPKGDKKIKIAVMDLISSIEVAALFNKYHMAAAKARKWEAQVFDLNSNFSQSESIMENIVAAGYDGIIVHWTTPKFYEVQLKKALAKGIPVLTIACGELLPGIVGDFAISNVAAGALNGEYLATKLGRGGKVITYYIPDQLIHRQRLMGAKGAFETYGVSIAQELYISSGDLSQQCYEACRNAFLADTKKEIRGVWTPWEGFGIPAARAAMDTGRKDVIVVTVDDSPNTYTEFQKLPTLHATAATLGLATKIVDDMFGIFDKAFAGQPVQTRQFYGVPPYLVTRENLPPKGYFFSFCGYKGRPPDFQVK
jgi:ABC-type sugar transport system substrate-binding protein